MRIALFGATGRVGKHVLDQALAAGHEVVALVRDPAKVAPRSGVRLVAGDADDAEAVRRAIAGCDAVVSALGPTKRGPADLMTRWTRHAIAAMKAEGVRRIVVVSGVWSGPRPRMALVARLFGLLARTFVRAAYEDKEAQLRLLRESGLDWVAVRPASLVDGPRSGRYRMGDVKLDRRFRVSTGDVADALLRHVAPDAAKQVMPVVTGA